MGAFLQIYVHNIPSNVECKRLQESLCDEGAVLDWTFLAKTIKIIASKFIK